MSLGGQTMGQLPARSMGLKLLLVCVLAMIMAIPAFFVFGLLNDRTQRENQVTNEVSGLVGGPQTFVGPILAIPFTTPPSAAGQAAGHGVYIVYPDVAQGDVTTRAELRQRSLFKVPVYYADLALRSKFDLTEAGHAAPQGAVLDWTRAEFLVGASDARGAQSDARLQIGQKSFELTPAITLTDASNGAQAQLQGKSAADVRFFGVPAGAIVTPNAKFEASTALRFSGAERLAVLPWGKTTSLSMRGDWPNPSFDGGLLPMGRTLSAKGFSANWTVPLLARGVPSEGPSDTLGRLSDAELGTSFVVPANPYQSVGRSLKYALLFVSLVFLSYFVFEVTRGVKVHPAQYLLIGLAQIVFYLLLLSIAEHTGFDIAFLIAAAATVGLISTYAGWVFKSRRQGVIALFVFSTVYAMIYVLMRLEDFALLVGALTSFAAITAVMYFTRKIDWYGVAAPPTPSFASKDVI